MYVVIVFFQIKHHAIETFLPAILENAATSLQDEPGCHQFDVCMNPDRRDEIFLYELYESQAAFEAHLTSDHFKAFDALVAPMIAAKEVRSYARVSP